MRCDNCHQENGKRIRFGEVLVCKDCNNKLHEHGQAVAAIVNEGLARITTAAVKYTDDLKQAQREVVKEFKGHMVDGLIKYLNGETPKHRNYQGRGKIFATPSGPWQNPRNRHNHGHPQQTDKPYTIEAFR